MEILNETRGGREITVEVMHNSWTQLSDNDKVGSRELGRELGRSNESSNESSVASTRDFGNLNYFIISIEHSCFLL